MTIFFLDFRKHSEVTYSCVIWTQKFLNLTSPHPIYASGILFAMHSRRFTVDPAKKEKFINIFLLMPETCVDDAIRSAKYTEEDIADLRMQRFLQRALPGGSIKGLKAYVAGLLPPQPHHNQRPMRLFDNAAIVAIFDATIVHVERTPPCHCQCRCQHRAEDNEAIHGSVIGDSSRG